MKLLIASDIHGSASCMELLMERIRTEAPDRIVLLGDLLYHGPRNDLPEGYAPKAVIPMLCSLSQRVLAVRGNCDAEVDQMVLDFPCMADYALLQPDSGVSIYATHGHLWSPDSLPPLTPGMVFLSGHTHMKLNRWRDGVLLLNPGSVSLPKDGSRSYMTYESGEFLFKTLDGTVIDHVTVLPNP